MCLLLVAVDITVYRNGYHGDLNETFFVGEVDEGARRLVQTTYECLMQAIDAGKPSGQTRSVGGGCDFHFLFEMWVDKENLIDAELMHMWLYLHRNSLFN